jgi:hypothetical protein
MIPDNPARTAPPGQLWSDQPFVDPFDVEPTDEELEDEFAALMEGE